MKIDMKDPGESYDYKQATENRLAHATENEYLLIKEECEAVNAVVDLIGETLPVFPDHHDLSQEMSVDLSKLSEKVRGKFRSIIIDLDRKNLVSYKGNPTPSFMATSRVSREMSVGSSVLINNVPAFEKYRKDVKGAQDLVEKVGFEKFGLAFQKKNGVAEFTVSLKDREIWINDFLLSEPQAVSKNMAFFEYLFNNPNKPIKRSAFPILIKEHLAGKSTTKIINELGFKGKIRKPFFPIRTKTEVMFRKKVTREDLEASGVTKSEILKELQQLRARNNPK